MKSPLLLTSALRRLVPGILQSAALLVAALDLTCLRRSAIHLLMSDASND